jgi:hypothetical protein
MSRLAWIAKLAGIAVLQYVNGSTAPLPPKIDCNDIDLNLFFEEGGREAVRAQCPYEYWDACQAAARRNARNIGQARSWERSLKCADSVGWPR